jgi:hypothetical protein
VGWLCVLEGVVCATELVLRKIRVCDLLETPFLDLTFFFSSPEHALSVEEQS